MATIRLVAGSDSPNEGRNIWNDNDTEINAELASLSSELGLHRTSSDHDGRYNTKDEVDAKDAVIQTNLNNHKASADHDAAYVKKTGNETIDGEKTFSGNVKISKSNHTALLTLDSFGTERNQGRLGHYNYGNYHSLSLSLNKATPENPNWEELIWAASNNDKLIIPNRDVFARNKKLATEEYVQDRVKTGFFVLTAGLNVASMQPSSEYFFKNPSGGNLRYMLPKSCTLRKVSLLSVAPDMTAFILKNIDVSYPFFDLENDNYEIFRFIEASIKTGSNMGGTLLTNLQLYKGTVKYDDPYEDAYRKEPLYNTGFTDRLSLINQAFQFDLSLLFSL